MEYGHWAWSECEWNWMVCLGRDDRPFDWLMIPNRIKRLWSNWPNSVSQNALLIARLSSFEWFHWKRQMHWPLQLKIHNNSQSFRSSDKAKKANWKVEWPHAESHLWFVSDSMKQWKQTKTKKYPRKTNMKNKYMRSKWKGMETPCTVYSWSRDSNLLSKDSSGRKPNVWRAHTS